MIQILDRRSTLSVFGAFDAFSHQNANCILLLPSCQPRIGYANNGQLFKQRMPNGQIKESCLIMIYGLWRDFLEYATQSRPFSRGGFNNDCDQLCKRIIWIHDVFRRANRVVDDSLSLILYHAISASENALDNGRYCQRHRVTSRVSCYCQCWCQCQRMQAYSEEHGAREYIVNF